MMPPEIPLWVRTIVSPDGMTSVIPLGIVRVSPGFTVSDPVKVQVLTPSHVPIALHEGPSVIVPPVANAL